MYMSACGVSKIQMKSIYSFTVEYWNANHFLKKDINFIFFLFSYPKYYLNRQVNY